MGRSDRHLYFSTKGESEQHPPRRNVQRMGGTNPFVIGRKFGMSKGQGFARGLVCSIGIVAAATMMLSTAPAGAVSLIGPGTASTSKQAPDDATRLQIRDPAGGGGFRGGGGGPAFHGGGGGFRGGPAFHGGGGGFRGPAFHGGGFRGPAFGGGFRPGPAFHGGFRRGPGFYGGGIRYASPVYYGPRRHYYRHHFFRPRYYGYGYAPIYYGPRYYHPRRFCRIVLTYYGPRKICSYRPWHHRHHWRRHYRINTYW